MANKTASDFLELVRMTYAQPLTKLVIPSPEELEISFHKLHLDFMKKSNKQYRMALEDSYPFLKLDGRWHISIPKMHRYLMSSRYALSQYSDPQMKKAEQAVINSQEYIEQAKQLDKLLTPGMPDGGYHEYQQRIRDLYLLHCMEQQALLIG